MGGLKRKAESSGGGKGKKGKGNEQTGSVEGIQCPPPPPPLSESLLKGVSDCVKATCGLVSLRPWAKNH